MVSEVYVGSAEKVWWWCCLTLERAPFTRYTSDEEERADTFTVRLNAEERLALEDLKEMLNVKSDGKALKIAGLVVGRNVLHGTFTKPLLMYLFKKDRQKLEDFKDFGRKM